jgi:hypothetical protein
MADGGPERVLQLRREAEDLDLHGNNLLEACKFLFDEKLREIAVQDAQSLFSEAEELRQRADEIEHSWRDHTIDP